MTSAAPSWVGLTLDNGRYAVTSLLGEGGMAYIYCATDLKRNVEVVLKAPKPALLADSEFKLRFAREVRTLVELKHSSVVAVLGFARNGEVPFAVLEYMAGGCLDDRPKPCSAAELRSWLPDIAAALDHVHASGYVHRDVKPANILFDAKGKARLSDFGIIKSIDEKAGTTKALTESGVAVGTPEYMAPELARGDQFDGRVDQYALAVSVYEMLAGRKPIDGKTGPVVLVNQIKNRPRPLDEFVPGISPALAEVVARGLAKDPRKRFANCSEFAAAVIRPPVPAQLKNATPSATATVKTALAAPSLGRRLAVWVLAFVAAFALFGSGALLLYSIIHRPPTAVAKATPEPGTEESQKLAPANLDIAPPIPAPPDLKKTISQYTIEPIGTIQLQPNESRSLRITVKRKGSTDGEIALRLEPPPGIRALPAEPIIAPGEESCLVTLTARADSQDGPGRVFAGDASQRFAIEIIRPAPTPPPVLPPLPATTKIGKQRQGIAEVLFVPNHSDMLVSWDKNPDLNIWDLTKKEAKTIQIGGVFVRGNVSPNGEKIATATQSQVFEHYLRRDKPDLTKSNFGLRTIGLYFSGPKLFRLTDKGLRSFYNQPDDTHKSLKVYNTVKFAADVGNPYLRDEGTKQLVWNYSGNLTTLEVPEGPSCWNLNPSGQWAIASGGGKIYVWQLSRGNKPIEGFPIEYPKVTAVSLSADAKQIALGTSEGEVHLMNVLTRP